MPENLSTLIVEFPVGEGCPLHWWHVDDGKLLAKGCDEDLLSVAGFSAGAAEVWLGSCIALMPAASSTVYWHEFIDDITDKQAMTAAGIAARENSLDGAKLHIAAAMQASDKAVVAAVKREIMTAGLERLQACGLNPDVIVPAGWLIPASVDGMTSADFGFEVILRSDRMIAPDEPALRVHLAGDTEISTLTEAEVDHLLVGAVSGSALNLRLGTFAKKTRTAMTAAQMKMLPWLVAALLLISIAIPLAQLAKYHWATNDSDNAALSSAQTVLSDVEDLETVEQRLDERLVSQNRGNIVFSVPASALFSAVQQTQGASIERLSYRNDGVVSAGLTALRGEDLNQVLTALQNAGFLVTTAPRSDATGSAKADITVRAP